MSRTHLLHAMVAVEGEPDDVVLAEPRPGSHTVVLGSALTLLLDTASIEYCRAIAAAFNEAADEKAEAAIVALNTPPLPVVDASIHTLRGPDWGTGRTA